MQVSFLTQLQERKKTAQGFYHEANGDFKTVTEFNCCDMRKLRMDQQLFGGCIILWVCLSSARTQEFFRTKINRVQLSTGKILEENLVQSTFQQTLGDTFTIQQDNNLKHKARYTLELLTKTTLNIPEGPSYSFDLNRIENLWQDLKMAF
uniref:Tc1-like transposase DDE domain-containing protein n=1 Tax=Oncorhynchus tshawytscha TaxID=74940 RepID=A0AAZ3R281_ONCTS